MCVQEEERLKHEKVESAHLATHVKENARKGKNALQVKKKHIKHNDNKNKTKCFFFLQERRAYEKRLPKIQEMARKER